MSDNLEYFFDELRTVTHGPVLASPAEIRRTAAHRTNVRRGVVTAAVALALIVVGLTAYGSGLLTPVPMGTEPPVSQSPTTVVTTTPTPEPSTMPSVGPSEGVPPRLAGADCRPADLDPLPYYGSGGAMGTFYRTLLVHNVSATQCRLYGHPTVLATDPSTGQRAAMPTTRRDAASPVLLEPGGWAEVQISTVNGNPYPPGAPECAHPRSYQGLALVIGDDLAYSLPGYSMSWECGEATISPWMGSQGPSQNQEQLEQARPAASGAGPR